MGIRIELKGCASKLSIVIMQCYQSTILRLLADVPCFVSNHILHTDLRKQSNAEKSTQTGQQP